MSDSLPLHGLQHARLPCPSLSPRVCSNSCPLSQLCYPTISSSVILFHPLLLMPSIFPSIKVFFNELALCIKGLELQLLHQSFQWTFRVDWFDLLGVQGTLKCLLQHHSWKPSVLQRSAWPSVKSQCPVVGFTLGLSVPMSASLLKWSWKSYIKSFIGSSLSCKINITIPPLLSIW